MDHLQTLPPDEIQQRRLKKASAPPPLSPVSQLGTAFVLGLFIFFLLALSGLGLFEIAHADRIYPGVTIGGVDVSGLTAEEARQLLSASLSFPVQGQVIITDQDNVWHFTPMNFGFLLDASASVQQAMQIGRGPLGTRLAEQFESGYYGREIAPVIIYDQRIANNTLEQLRAEIDVETVEASLLIENNEVRHHPGQHGRRLNVAATLMVLEPYLFQLQSVQMPALVDELPAGIVDASREAELARVILSQEFQLALPGNESPGPWTLDTGLLARMLTLKRVENEGESPYFGLGIDRQLFAQFLGQHAPALVRTPQNPRLIFNDDTRQLEVIQSAVIGREVNISASADAMEAAIRQGSHLAEVQFNYTNPPVLDTTRGEELGIVELVHAETSYFYGSSSGRVQNIRTAAAEFHGILVPPQSVFSMASHMGSITLDNGYAEAWIIFGGRTVKGVGGGVCQVSTTLFRAAFFAGFPIVERHPHAYRVSFYEKTAGNRRNTNLAGLDAAVYFPVVDLRFTNDTDNWLLIETYVHPASSSITFKFYGTRDNRQVNWSTTGLTNIVPEPEPLYIFNESLGEGEIKQVDWGVPGASVTVFREVTRDGNILFNDTISTRYQAWRNVYEFGPNAELPEGAQVDER